MSPSRYLLVTDTPGIKQFVFGTDALAEVRGASALLDRLNRDCTIPTLSESLPAEAECIPVFANGGTGQFILHVPDTTTAEGAVHALARFYREQTGGDLRIVWGLVPWPEAMPYQEAAREAYFQLRTSRETARDNRTAAQMPLLLECGSSSHLPALPQPYRWGGESLMLSEAVRGKREEARLLRESGPWIGWMDHLSRNGPWPDRGDWRTLRAREAEALEEARQRDRAPARKGYVGLVYADGNAMGRLVQELDDQDTCKAFSELVDLSIRDACHQALDEVCAEEIAAQRASPDKPRPLPADILLLGGDDLLVLLPADVTLPFTLCVTEAFEKITRRRINDLPPGSARAFFEKRLKTERSLTISCGVALAPAKYPFYLLLDLAEDLLRSAKQGGSRAPEAKGEKYWAPSYVDFHLIVGPAGADLAAVREEDYFVGRNDTPWRTLRPYSRDRLRGLRDAVECLQQARIPRSKLQDLFDAALDPRASRAELHSRELFARLREDRVHHERRALWQALLSLGMGDDFPWCVHNGQTATALADLVEASDLFPRTEETP